MKGHHRRSSSLVALALVLCANATVALPTGPGSSSSIALAVENGVNVQNGSPLVAPAYIPDHGLDTTWSPALVKRQATPVVPEEAVS